MNGKRTENRRPAKPNLPLYQRLGYKAFQTFLRLTFIPMFGVRFPGRERFPKFSGGLVCSNHQSHLDPLLLGILPNRQMSSLARQTLFDNWLLAPFIRFLDAIPLDRDGLGIAGIKETMRRMKRGQLVAIYPEGTRTSNGQIGPFKPGFITIARRCSVPLIPVAISGAYQAWPKGTPMFKPSKIVVCCGDPLWPDAFESMTDDELLVELEKRIRACFEAAERKRLNRSR